MLRRFAPLVRGAQLVGRLLSRFGVRARSSLRRAVPLAGAALAYAALLVGFAVAYKAFFDASLGRAHTASLHGARKAAYTIAIGLSVQTRAAGVTNVHRYGTVLKYRALAWLAPATVAFSFTNPDHFVEGSEELRDEIHVSGNLSVGGGSGGPAKSMPSGPLYELFAWYYPHPLQKASSREAPRFAFPDDPLRGSRFPSELAPPGVFSASDHHWSPPIGAATHAKYFSVSLPEDVFLRECAEYIEGHLRIYIDREYKKWASAGRLSTFVYFAATFGLGELRPASQAARLTLVAQIVLSVLFAAIALPMLNRRLTVAVQTKRRREPRTPDEPPTGM
jgi:hypothetical protein